MDAAVPGGTAARRERRLARLRSLAGWLDDRFRVPGTGWRFGLDGLLGLVPGIGDAIAAYIVLEARRFGAPWGLLARMAANVGIDFAVGAVPVVGDVFDLGWKANRRNVALLTRHLERSDREMPATGPVPHPVRTPAAAARARNGRSG